ncbi:Ig-like domain-containing protein [Svornostia abyssi]
MRLHRLLLPSLTLLALAATSAPAAASCSAWGPASKMRTGETRDLTIMCSERGTGPVQIQVVTPFTEVTAAEHSVARNSLTLRITASTGFIGYDRIAVRAVDAFGADPISQIGIQITPPEANDPPECQIRGASAATETNAPINLMLACDDLNQDSYTLEAAVPPAHGTVTSEPFAVNRIPEETRAVRYHPAPGFSGMDFVAVRARDDHGGVSPTYTFGVLVRGAGVPDPLVAPASLPAPTLTLGTLPTLGRALRNGVTVQLGAAQAGTATVDLRLDGRTAKRLRLSRGSAITVARGRATLQPGATRTIRARFTTAAKRRLARVKSVRLTVRATIPGQTLTAPPITLRR